MDGRLDVHLVRGAVAGAVRIGRSIRLHVQRHHPGADAARTTGRRPHDHAREPARRDDQPAHPRAPRLALGIGRQRVRVGTGRRSTHVPLPDPGRPPQRDVLVPPAHARDRGAPGVRGPGRRHRGRGRARPVGCARGGDRTGAGPERSRDRRFVERARRLDDGGDARPRGRCRRGERRGRADDLRAGRHARALAAAQRQSRRATTACHSTDTRSRSSAPTGDVSRRPRRPRSCCWRRESASRCWSRRATAGRYRLRSLPYDRGQYGDGDGRRRELLGARTGRDDGRRRRGARGHDPRHARTRGVPGAPGGHVATARSCSPWAWAAAWVAAWVAGWAAATEAAVAPSRSTARRSTRRARTSPSKLGHVEEWTLTNTSHHGPPVPPPRVAVPDGRTHRRRTDRTGVEGHRERAGR